MKSLSALLLATLLVALSSACKSTTKSDIACVCGTALGDLEGCDHSLCRDGEANPDNPNCVCGGIEIPSKKKN